MDELEAHFKVSTIASAKAIIDALIDIACKEGECEKATGIETDITLEAVASYNSKGTKNYTLQTVFHAYDTEGAGTAAKSNFGSALVEWEDVITESNMYDSVNSVEGSVVVSPCDFGDASDAVYDPTNPTTISHGQEALIKVLNGAQPFTWAVVGGGLAFAEGETSVPSNALVAPPIPACGGLATITVIDACETEVGGDVTLSPPPFVYDEGNPSTIEIGGSEVITVVGEAVPFNWSVGGDGFSFVEGQTEGLTNTLEHSGSGCDPASTAVTDNCGTEITKEVALEIPEFGMDEGNPETIAPGQERSIGIVGGAPPYSWELSGFGFTWKDVPTPPYRKTLVAALDSCGPAEITVTDACDSEVKGFVLGTEGNWHRCSPHWAKSGTQQDCGTPPLYGIFNYYSGPYHIWGRCSGDGRYAKTLCTDCSGGGGPSNYCFTCTGDPCKFAMLYVDIWVC